MLLYRIVFVAVLIVLLAIKQIQGLAVALVLLCVWLHRDGSALHQKVLRSVVWFNAGVSAGYVLVALMKGTEPWEYLLYINLKVYTLTLFVFGFFKRVNIIAFFSFSKDLSYLLTIAMSQIFSYQKSFEEFRTAYKARVVRRLTSRKKRFVIRIFEQFMKRSLQSASERTLAMKARGFFD